MIEKHNLFIILINKVFVGEEKRFLKENKKIFIEFFGLRGSGKSTICDSLLLSLREERRGDIITGEEFKKYKTFYKFFIPAIATGIGIRKRLNILSFFKENWRALHDPHSYLSHCEEVYKLFKKMLVAHFIFSKQNFRYFIADQFMIYALGLFHSETKINFLSLMNAYPGDMIFLVFVNTPPEIAEERRMKRKEKGFVWEDSLSEFDRLNL